MSKLPTCKGKEAVKAFKKNGWVLARYIDDHLSLRSKEKGTYYQYQIIIR
jgi:predicted RNA binding protein YcfA (HicA-like mRNA interferase family)